MINFYYRIKPFIPARLRVALRRFVARRKRIQCGDVWPILESAGRKPTGWNGWPEGKRFAVVLTHDVESQRGVDRVRDVAEMEMSLGFRSSFNFIPEGDYQVSTELRNWLTKNGFEVGVHDHRHDGKLYQSRESFSASATRINHFLSEWGAVGFRSGFMLHNLEWIHDLEVLYDASTFDTDPFEPQPDGVGTIFPFWVADPRRVRAAVVAGLSVGETGTNPLASVMPEASPVAKGYVELPYTLPQDFTLLVILGEKTCDLWTRKVRWISERGGMVLLNVHPDYMAFKGDTCGFDEFDASLYAQFLGELSSSHSGQYWPVLPRQMAGYWRKNVLGFPDGASPVGMSH